MASTPLLRTSGLNRDRRNNGAPCCSKITKLVERVAVMTRRDCEARPKPCPTDEHSFQQPNRFRLLRSGTSGYWTLAQRVGPLEELLVGGCEVQRIGESGQGSLAVAATAYRPVGTRAWSSENQCSIKDHTGLTCCACLQGTKSVARPR